MESSAQGSRGRRFWLFLLLVTVLPLILFRQALDRPFLCDDYMLFANVSGVSYHAAPDRISAYQLFVPEVTREHPETMPWWGSPEIRLHFLRPLATLVLKLDYWIWENNPTGFHLTNLLVHSLVCMILFLVGRRLFRDDTTALLAVLIFTASVRTFFVVSWVADRVVMLSLFWGLFGLYSHVVFRSNGRKTWALISWLCFILAFLSKESGAIFVAAYFLFDVFIWRQNEPDAWPGLIRLGIRYIVFSIPLFLFVAYFVLAGYGVAGPYSIVEGNGTLVSKAGYVAKNLLLYGLGLLFHILPTQKVSLLLFHQTAYVVTLLILILLATLLFWPGFRRRTFLQGIYPFLFCWLLLSLLPTLTFIPQDRFLYTVSAPFGLMMASYLLTMKRSAGFGRFTRSLFYGIVAFLVVLPMTLVMLKPTLFEEIFQRQTRIVQHAGDSLPLPSATGEEGPVDVVLVNLPTWLEVYFLQYAFDFHYGKGIFRVFPLTVSRTPPTVEVLDNHSLRISSSGKPFLESEWERFFVAEQPIREGFTCTNSLFTATVEQVRNGEVHAIRFDFSSPPQEAGTRFLVVEDGDVHILEPFAETTP